MNAIPLPLLDPPGPRSCGPCSACCEVLAVVALGKPYYCRCVSVAEGGGCQVYDQRPTECRAFRCLWLSGDVPCGDDARPDRMGILWTMSVDDDHTYLLALETRPNAFEEADHEGGQMLADYLARKLGCDRWRLYYYGSRVSVDFDAQPPYQHAHCRSAGNLFLRTPGDAEIHAGPRNEAGELVGPNGEVTTQDELERWWKAQIKESSRGQG